MSMHLCCPSRSYPPPIAWDKALSKPHDCENVGPQEYDTLGL